MMQLLKWFGVVLMMVLPSLAWAHSDIGGGSGFLSGFMHPVSGLDHVTAMVAVGILGAFMGKPAIWILPITFPIVMALGGVLGLLGIPLPGIEIGIAVSSIILGIMILLGTKPPLAIAVAIVAAFAIFHGYAHGAELPQAANPVAYSAGFVISTGLLHLAGIAFGELIRIPHGVKIVRASGVVIALLGSYFLMNVFQ